MERKIKKFIITSGIVLGLGTAFLPLTSYAIPGVDEGDTPTPIDLGDGDEEGDGGTPAPIADTPAAPIHKSGAVSLTVNQTLSLEITGSDTTNDPEHPGQKALQFNLASNMTAEKDFTAVVTSNSKHLISVHSDTVKYDPDTGNDVAALVHSDSGVSSFIPSKASCSIATGNTCWKIRLKDGGSYQPVPTSITTFYDKSSAGNSSVDFRVGVAIGTSNIAAGTYTGSLIVTASNYQ